MVRKIKWSVSGRDIDEIPDDDFEVYDGPVPPKGVYQARIKSIRQVESSNGNEMLKVLLIVDGEASGKPKYDGAPVFDNVTVMESTMFKVKQFMTALGGTGRDFDLTAIDDDDNVVKFGRIRPVGMLVRFASKTEVYEGDPSAKVARYLPPKEEELEYDDEEADEEVDDADEDEDDEEEEAPPPPRKVAKKATAKKAAPRARRRADEDDEPPF